MKFYITGFIMASEKDGLHVGFFFMLWLWAPKRREVGYKHFLGELVIIIQLVNLSYNLLQTGM